MGARNDSGGGAERRRVARRAVVAGAIWMCCLPADVAAAQAPEPPPAGGELRVAVDPVPPFVIEEPDGSLTGFSIELLDMVAERADVDVTYILVGGVQAQIAAVESGTADAAIGAISITADREERIDFSQSYFQTGIQIAARPTSAPSPSGLEDVGSRVLSGTLLAIVVVAAVGTLLVGAIVWWLERNHNGQFARDPRVGVPDGLWWATETLFSATYGDKAPRRLVSRAIAGLWMIVSVILIATLIAEVTADATVERLEATITSIDDLHGRDVVVVDGTAAASFLDERGVTARPVATSSDGVEAVASGAAEAVVDDSAILRYLVTQRNGDAVEVVGPTLRTEHYGIALRPGSDLVERVNLALLRVTGSVAYDRLVDAYFG